MTQHTDVEQHLQEILVEQSYITEQDLDAAQQYADERGSTPLSYLLQQDLITRDLFGQAVSEYYNVPFEDINANGLPDRYTELLPYELATEYRAVVARVDDDALTVATDDIEQDGLNDALAQAFPDRELSIAYALPNDIDDALGGYRSSLDTRFAELINKESVKASDLITEVFEDALAFEASDIHFEPRADEVLVRFRVDGVLEEAGRIPKEYYPYIVNRVKVEAELRIDTHGAMQDGAMQYVSTERTGERTVDMRISIAPTLEGEKIVLRLLAKYIRDFSLSGLGLTSKQQAQLQEAAHKPFGMILVAGPTGSGKTTTLYAVLKMLNESSVNITTIEDPVEYRLTGVNQIQVDESTGVTFAEGLRSIVRQDPDIVLVGEIRDRETNEIALNAALTGHLMLSTFHANDAATGVPRLMDMGAEPFLVASTLEVIVAQRLVRTICGHCRHSVEYSKQDLEELSSTVASALGNSASTLYKGKGCRVCGQSGYNGRSAVFEIVTVDQEMRNLIMTSPSSDEIRKRADEMGQETMFENGMEKVKAGETTIEELLRVVVPPESGDE